jgi:hypothetical protein
MATLIIARNAAVYLVVAVNSVYNHLKFCGGYYVDTQCSAVSNGTEWHEPHYSW